MTRLPEMQHKDSNCERSYQSGKSYGECLIHITKKLNIASLFMTPPGYNQCHTALQRFVYLVTDPTSVEESISLLAPQTCE